MGQKRCLSSNAKHFPNLMNTVNPQIQGARWTSSIRNMKKIIPKHINYFWNSEKKGLTYSTTNVRITADF